MLREIRLRLENGIPSHPLVKAVQASRSMTSVHDANWLGEESSGIMVVRGDPDEIECLARTCECGIRVGGIREARLVERSRRRLVCYTRFGRPASSQGASLEHTVHDLLGPAAILRYEVSRAGIDVRVVAEHMAEGCLVSKVRAVLAQSFAVRVVFVGDHQVDHGRAPALSSDCTSLLRTALKLGYYETPRRVSLEDLSEAVGRCRSAIFERLRGLEAQAVHELVRRADVGVRNVDHRESDSDAHSGPTFPAP